MHTLFDDLDTLLTVPYQAFEKKLAKLEEDFKDINSTEIMEEELESYFTRIRDEYRASTGDSAKSRLSIIGYIAHFDTLVEKYFPDYVALFQETLDRSDALALAPMNYSLLEHIDDILRDYTHRLSEPDRYPSYTAYIQELVQNSMIDCFFWLQERENAQEKTAKEADKNTDIHIVASIDTKNPALSMTRRCLELLGSGVLEKIFFDLGYQPRVSPTDSELHLIGRYERKKK